MSYDAMMSRLQEAVTSVDLSLQGLCHNDSGLRCANFECAWFGKCKNDFNEVEKFKSEVMMNDYNKTFNKEV